MRSFGSQLAIYSASHEVAPAVQPSRWDAVRRLLERPLWSLLSLGALFITALLTRLSETVAPLTAETLVSVATTLAFGLGVWVLFWGVLSKLWRDSMHFRAHLSIAACAAASGYVIRELGEFIGWQIQNVEVSELITNIGQAVLLLVALALTLGVATRLSKRVIFWLACGPGALLLLSIYLLPMLEDEEIERYPTLVSGSYPPGWQIIEGRSLQNFLGESPSLYESSAKRAADRAKELSEL